LQVHYVAHHTTLWIYKQGKHRKTDRRGPERWRGWISACALFAVLPLLARSAAVKAVLIPAVLARH
jgi:hypothetical protein